MRILQKVCIFASDISTYKVIMNMKTMKSFGFFLMLLVLGVGFSSCGEDYESRLPELLIKDMTFEASSTSQTQSQQFRNEDMSNFSITTDASWCTAKIDYDTSTINVTVNARGTSEPTDADPYSDRSCLVTITDVRDNTVRSFNVSQKQINEIKPNANEFPVQSEGGEVTIEVQHNIGYSLIIPDDATSWIHKKAAGTRAMVTDTETLTVDANNSGSARNATLTIQSSDENVVRKVKITQTFNPVYSIETKDFTIDELAQTVKVNITANFKYEIYPEADWVSSGGRETVSETEFVQRLDVTAFKEKEASRATVVEFYANVKTAEGIYREIKESINITQNRTLYIPKDTLHLAVGDSAVVEVTNTEKRDLVWSSSDEKEFTVDAKGQVKCISTEGDGKATITVKSKDGKYSDEIVAVAKKPIDLTKYLKCTWVIKEDIKEGVSTKTLNFNIKNTSDQSVTLVKYNFYKDSLDVSPWAASDLSEPLGGNGSKTIDLGSVPTTNYYMSLNITYLNEKYILGFSQKGYMTIKKEEAPKTAATRRSTRTRR